MYGYVDPFYEAADAACEAGHVWADQPLYLPPKHGLKISRVNPEDDRDLDFKIWGRTDDLFGHAPVKSLDMKSTDALVVGRTKRDRPVIILGGMTASHVTPRGGTPEPLEIVWAVPVYGCDQYDEAIRRRIQIYDFRNLFYLPADAALGFDEGFARLDHAQPIPRHMLRTHRGLALSSDALAALREWFIYFTTDHLPEDTLILEYRREQTASG